MRMMLQFLALGRPALRGVCCLTRTACRRPLMVAVATGLAMLHALPGGEPVQPVEILDSRGTVEQVFTLAVDDPQVEALRQAAEQASHPDYRKRSPDYYRAQWDAVTAEFYLAESRRVAAGDTATAAALAATGDSGSSTVSPVSYQPAPGAMVAVAVARAAGSAERDWVAFWEQLRETATARMRTLEPAPRVDPMFARMQFGVVAPGPYPTSTVFAALCIAVVGFLATSRWACRPPRRLIGLRTARQLEVPAEWIRQRRSWRDLRTVWTGGRLLEGTAAVLVVVFLSL